MGSWHRTPRAGFSAVFALAAAVILAAVYAEGAAAGPRLVAPSLAPVGSCARPETPPPGVDQPVPEAGLDLVLLDKALRLAASAARCRAGLNTLAADNGLAAAARTHAEAMAKRGHISHGGDGIYEDFQTRLRAGRVRYRAAGENLFQHPRLTLQPDREYMIVSVENCLYADLVTGEAPRPHTYRSLAESLIAGWLRSEGHRDNLLNPEHTRVGAAAAVRTIENRCGDVYAAQLYAN